jgi:hypothetical protein
MYPLCATQHEKAAANAVEAMNNFELAGRRLKVGAANSGSGGGGGGGMSATLPGAIGGIGGMGMGMGMMGGYGMGMGMSMGMGMAGTASNSMPLGPATGMMGMGMGVPAAPVFASAPIPVPTAPAPPAPAPDAPSRLLLLENLVDADEVDGELQGEVAEEVRCVCTCVCVCLCACACTAREYVSFDGGLPPFPPSHTLTCTHRHRSCSSYGIEASLCHYYTRHFRPKRVGAVLRWWVCRLSPLPTQISPAAMCEECRGYPSRAALRRRCPSTGRWRACAWRSWRVR